MEGLPFGPSTPKRLKLLFDKGEGLARCWYVVRPRRCWPQPYDCLAPGVYSAAALARCVGEMQHGDRSALFREQLCASLQEADAASGQMDWSSSPTPVPLPPVVTSSLLLTAANHLSAAYEELRVWDIIPASVPPIPLIIVSR